MNARRLRNAVSWHRPDLVSLDCFDTLLLRGVESEEERVRRLGYRIAAALRAEGISFDPHAVASTRLASARAEYRAAACEGREARHATMVRLQCVALGLAPSFADLLTEAEIEILDRMAESSTPAAPRTVSYYLTRIAKLGGYLARAKDPPPGNMVLWRGLTRLTDIHLGFELKDRVVGN